ncbi:MAG: hypothetical protein KJN71_04675 [Acidimicrobiia bacterium]|nr:hypothetical protein [Acidimicrobiia bacterium]NNC74136.1 hypothetical protein [Acidimicrobiia bacterium]
MHDHDFDLVMAIAAGEAVDTERRTEVDGCPECSADLTAQMAAITALSTLGPATLEPNESDSLRAAIRQELNLAEPSPAVASPRSKPRFTWAWVGAAAMVMIGFVAVAGIFDGLRTDGSDSGGETAALATSTTIATSTSAASAQSDEANVGTAPNRGGDSLGSTEDTESPAATPDVFRRFDFESVDPDALRDLTALEPARAYSKLGSDATPATPIPLEVELACEEAGLAEVGTVEDAYPLFEGTYEGSAAYLWVYVTSDGQVTVIQDTTTCAVVAVLP